MFGDNPSSLCEHMYLRSSSFEQLFAFGLLRVVNDLSSSVALRHRCVHGVNSSSMASHLNCVKVSCSISVFLNGKSNLGTGVRNAYSSFMTIWTDSDWLT